MMKFFYGTILLGFVIVPVLIPSIIPPAFTNTVEDFGAYWCAAKVARQGGNPYDSEQLWVLESSIEAERPQPLLTFSPPWAITFIVPFTWVDYPAARWLFLLFQVSCIAGCTALFWKMYGGSDERLGVAWLLAFAFFPTLQLIALGQMSVFTLLGLTGFLHFHRHKRDLLSGACLVFSIVKPHNVMIFGIVLLIDALVHRRRGVILGGVMAIGILSAIFYAIHPQFFSFYQDTMANRPPSMMQPPTFGTYLRMAFGGEHFWLAFVPLGIGTLGMMEYYRRHSSKWDWQEKIFPVLFASILVSPYAWIYDSVILALPLVWLAATKHISNRGIGFYLILMLICILMNARKMEEYWFGWLPIVLAIDFGIRSHSPNQKRIN